MDIKYKVVEIFDSIEGEGKRAGATASFIRLAGCNLRCTYCDTEYALAPDDFQIMNIDGILARLEQRRLFRVTLTGGEPLIAENIECLVHRLLSAGYEVNIETNGSVDISDMLNYLESSKVEHRGKLFFTMDYKLPSSGVTDKMLMDNFRRLRPWDVLKFVVGGRTDAERMIEFLTSMNYCNGGTASPLVYIGAVYGGYGLQDLAATILDTPVLKDARLQLQFHKIIWDPEQRGV